MSSSRTRATSRSASRVSILEVTIVDLNFGKYRFWRWILYGTCQTLMLQIIGFHSLEGGEALYDRTG